MNKLKYIENLHTKVKYAFLRHLMIVLVVNLLKVVSVARHDKINQIFIIIVHFLLNLRTLTLLHLIDIVSFIQSVI